MHGHFDMVKYMHSMEPRVALAVNTKGSNAFHYACSGGKTEVVKFLLSNAASICTAYNTIGMCGLHFAIIQDHIELVKLLLTEGGYDPHEITPCGKYKRSPLHFACIHGKLEVARYLVSEFHVDVGAVDSIGGNTALHFASRNGYLDVVQFLLENNATDTISCGLTALHMASRCGHLDVVQCLTRQLCSKVNSRGNDEMYDGFTALHFATRNGYLEVVRYLVLHGKADVEQRTRSGITALQIAKQCESLAMVNLLLDLGGKMNDLGVGIDFMTWSKISNIGMLNDMVDFCKSTKVWNRSGKHTTICSCIKHSL
jgi:ankyrin repeat protein